MVSSINLFCASIHQQAISYASKTEMREGALKTATIAWEVLKVALAIKFNPYCALFALGTGLLFPEAMKTKLDELPTLLSRKNRIQSLSSSLQR